MCVFADLTRPANPGALHEHCGNWFTAAKLSELCLLVKRAVHETIGGLDERFGLELFDDDDPAARARKAGFELALAHDLFTHHFGSRTFTGAGIDAERPLSENGRGRRLDPHALVTEPDLGDRHRGLIEWLGPIIPLVNDGHQPLGQPLLAEEFAILDRFRLMIPATGPRG